MAVTATSAAILAYFLPLSSPRSDRLARLDEALSALRTVQPADGISRAEANAMMETLHAIWPYGRFTFDAESLRGPEWRFYLYDADFDFLGKHPYRIDKISGALRRNHGPSIQDFETFRIWAESHPNVSGIDRLRGKLREPFLTWSEYF